MSDTKIIQIARVDSIKRLIKAIKIRILDSGAKQRKLKLPPSEAIGKGMAYADCIEMLWELIDAETDDPPAIELICEKCELQEWAYQHEYISIDDCDEWAVDNGWDHPDRD